MTAPLLLDPPPPPVVEALSGQLAVIREMLSTLENLTTAGQHHIMGKVVDFLQLQVWRAAHAARPGSRQALIDMVGHLRREANRLLPSVETFTDRAEHLVTMLSAVA
jgi:hypothetical protein